LRRRLAETAIGLFPDVGGSFFLPRLPSSFGMYLALTGARLKGSETVVAGVATHYVPRASLTDLKRSLAAVRTGSAEEVTDIINSFSKPVDASGSELQGKAEVIDRCFSEDSVEAIVARLKAEATPWTDGVVSTLAKMSPTSLKITFEQVNPDIGGWFGYRFLCACSSLIHVFAGSAEQAVKSRFTCMLGYGAAHGFALHGGMPVQIWHLDFACQVLFACCGTGA
jgi:hypothetical protein